MYIYICIYVYIYKYIIQLLIPSWALAVAAFLRNMSLALTCTKLKVVSIASLASLPVRTSIVCATASKAKGPRRGQ